MHYLNLNKELALVMHTIVPLHWQGGQFAAVNLESRVGLLAARQVIIYTSQCCSIYIFFTKWRSIFGFRNLRCGSINPHCPIMSMRLGSCPCSVAVSWLQECSDAAWTSVCFHFINFFIIFSNYLTVKPQLDGPLKLFFTFPLKHVPLIFVVLKIISLCFPNHYIFILIWFVPEISNKWLFFTHYNTLANLISRPLQAVGDLPGRCGDPNAWYRLCENSPRNLCLCAGGITSFSKLYSAWIVHLVSITFLHRSASRGLLAGHLPATVEAPSVYIDWAPSFITLSLVTTSGLDCTWKSGASLVWALGRLACLINRSYQSERQKPPDLEDASMLSEVAGESWKPEAVSPSLSSYAG